jgi:7-cyano-7-deazaguanine synthase
MLSGGMGSAVAAYRQPKDVALHLLHLDYGRQSAYEERQAASNLAQALQVDLTVLDLPHVHQIAEALRADLGEANRQAADGLGSPGDIPGLRSALLAIGAEYAAAVGAHALVLGQTAEPPAAESTTGLSRERTTDPRECFQAFTYLLEASLPSVRTLRLETPLIDLQPFQVVKLGLRFKVPLELTWSCHRTAPPCRTCPGCNARAEALAQAGIADPLLAPASA